MQEPTHTARINVLNEVYNILATGNMPRLTGWEIAKCSSLIQAGMVNPYDVLNTVRHSGP